MFELVPISLRVQKMRSKYRDTMPAICIARYRLVTEYWMNNPQLTGILKKAKCFRHICENIPVLINDDELIVGEQGASYRSSALYPEQEFSWILKEIDTIEHRDLDPYLITEEDRAYIKETAAYWLTHSVSAKVDAYSTDLLTEHDRCEVTTFAVKGQCKSPIGHFTANHHTAIHKGFGAIRAEALAKARALEHEGMPYGTIQQYHFYRAIAIVCEGMITLTKRYAAEAKRQAEACAEPGRKAELAAMADTLDRVMERPCESFMDAVQCVFMYQTCLALDGNLHGMSIGRLDQYLGEFYERDVASGKLTPERAQEIIDLLYLKLAEMNKCVSHIATAAAPGYTAGQLITLGGVDADGNDATNPVTYMMLQTAARLFLHSPPQALRIHKNTPPELWNAALSTTRRVGGVPSLESDDVIIPALMKRGHTLESARNYCLNGCVEPSGCGNEWPACGGDGAEAYFNIANCLNYALNDGYKLMPEVDGSIRRERVGLATGNLRDMKSMDEVIDAYKKQVEFFLRLHIGCTNSFEYVAAWEVPNPVASATITGCMESGKDVLWGGAEYNSTGMSGIGLGNVVDSLQMIEHLVFDRKLCTAAELQDALVHNWEGHEALYEYIQTRAPHFGNGDDASDKYMGLVTHHFTESITRYTGPRGNHYAVGFYPVTANIHFGKRTAATPDGRKMGVPLSDGISPLQGKDVSGLTAMLRSVMKFDDQVDYSNGTLMNLKFDPKTCKTDADLKKLAALLQTYFANGGMEAQINIVDGATLRAAQEKPMDYRDLVVRVAGFSSYFVDLAPEGQRDLISRTEHSL